jgi:RNA polymerase sigma factor (sigma-70 family)
VSGEGWLAVIDSSELSRWFDAYAAGLGLYARQWLTADAAEDVVQEVFLRLISRWLRPNNIKAWLYRSVRNAAIDRQRLEQRRYRLEQRQVAEQPPRLRSGADDLMDAVAVEKALADLPAEQRELIVLRIWGEMGFREISEVTGTAVSTLFSRYQAALAALRKAMERPRCRT